MIWEQLAYRLVRFRGVIAAVTCVLVVLGVFHAWNMHNNPMRFEDEGTYVQQADAILTKGALAHYTYFYDHPPVGWIQMAGYWLVSGAPDRYESPISAGREFMLVLKLVSSLLLYLLSRRLGLGRAASLAVMLLFGLNPLSVHFQRQVFLDNIAMPWLLASFWMARDPQRRLFRGVFISGVLFGIAVLTKETLLLLLPALVYMHVQYFREERMLPHRHLLEPDDRRLYGMVLLGFGVFGTLSFYALFAGVKGEFFPSGAGILVPSKETMLVLLPALVYFLVRNRYPRKHTWGILVVAILATISIYAAVAQVMGEFSPYGTWLVGGANPHVSLLGTVMWQLFERAGSGSVLDPSSGARGIVNIWLGLDRWLLLASVALMIPAWLQRKLRPMAVGLAIQLLMLLRGGYLPYMYVVAMLPFAAVITAGVIAKALPSAQSPWSNLLPDGFWWGIKHRLHHPSGWLRLLAPPVGRLLALGTVLGLAIVILPEWQAELRPQLTQNQEAHTAEMIDWVASNLDQEQLLVIDSSFWLDLYNAGFQDPRAVSLYKADTDPEVRRQLQDQGIDYIIVTNATLHEKNRDEFPRVFAAKDRSRAIARFGEGDFGFTVWEVQDAPPDDQPVAANTAKLASSTR